LFFYAYSKIIIDIYIESEDFFTLSPAIVKIDMLAAIFIMIKLQCQSKSIKNISLYDVASLSSVPLLSTAVVNAVISLSDLSGLIAILSPSI
jgi:hypothetical protein